MALPSRYRIDKKINSMEGLSAYENGGKGSGNFGHAGRPGKRGGSGSGTGGIKMPERAKDPHDWFKTVQEIKKGATEERRKELDKVVDEVSEAIYETGESYTGSKKKTLDFIEANILFHADTDNFDADAFLDVASEWLDDYKRVKASKAKKFRITENPMSGTDVVIDEA